LSLADLQAGFAPDALHPPEINLAALSAQKRRNPPVAVARVSFTQFHDLTVKLQTAGPLTKKLLKQEHAMPMMKLIAKVLVAS
jgi:hypothetical protein